MIRVVIFLSLLLLLLLVVVVVVAAAANLVSGKLFSGRTSIVIWILTVAAAAAFWDQLPPGRRLTKLFNRHRLLSSLLCLAPGGVAHRIVRIRLGWPVISRNDVIIFVIA